MNVVIKRIGYKVGTCGWLAEGLESGEIRLEEGLCQAGDHGLWLKFGKCQQQFLAGFNQHGLQDRSLPGATRYDVIEDERDASPLFTPACLRILMNIAKQWCDQCNEEREEDPPVQISIKRLGLITGKEGEQNGL